MYRAYYYIQPDCIEPNSIFTPFLNCYLIQNLFVIVNGVNYIEGSDNDFEINDYMINWLNSDLSPDYNIIVQVDYFYIRSENNDVLSFIVDRHGDYTNANETKAILSEHYMNAQFSIDVGLYKNAVLNLGTVIETLLNKDLGNIRLNNLINSYSGPADNSLMHDIRELRNAVHPNVIVNHQEVTKEHAMDVRNKTERILKNF